MQQAQKTMDYPVAPPPVEHYVEEPVGGFSVGPISISYGSLTTDLLAGGAVLILVIIGYIAKKKIDKRFRNRKR